MIGLIALFTLIVLFRTLIAVSKWLTRGMTGSPAAIFFTRLAIILGFFPLALSDEIIGAMQHAYWCRRDGIKSADLSRAKGKEVIMHHGLNSSNISVVSFTAIPIQRYNIVRRMRKQKKSLQDTIHMTPLPEGGLSDMRGWTPVRYLLAPIAAIIAVDFHANKSLS